MTDFTGEKLKLAGFGFATKVKELGPEKLALLLIKMGKARRDYIKKERWDFVPVAP